MNHSEWVRAGWLVDGTGAPAIKDALLQIKGGRIIAVSSSPAPEDSPARVLDFSSCTVIPGLVDSHVHMVMSGTTDMAVRERQLFVSYQDALPVMKGHCRDHIAHGVVAVRDGGDWGGHALAFARSGQANPLIVKSAGKAWRAAGRYGKLVGRAPHGNQTLAQGINTNKENPDFIKIVGSGLNSLLSFGKQTPPQFTRQELTEAVQAARSQGLDVMVHANGEEPVRVALEAGCTSIEHGFFMGDDNLRRMADRQIVWAPTAVTMESYAASLPSDDPKAAGALKNLDHQLGQMARARQFGVPMACGSDAGSTGVNHGEALMREMALFIRAGYGMEEAVQAASATGAKMLGLTHMGVLQAEKDATWVAVEGPPDQFSNIITKPVCVMITGRRH